MSEESQEREEEQERSRGFRVSDRRRFSSESGGPESGEPGSAEVTDEKRDAGPEKESPIRDTTQSADPQETASSPPAEITFSSFILGLSTQALMYLGEVPPAVGQTAPTDLFAAQQMIDVIAMLQRKTVGNLDTGEAQMLESILFDLRMRYVELKKKGRSS